MSGGPGCPRPSLVWGGGARSGRGLPRSQSLFPASAGAAAPRRDRPGYPRAHHVPGARRFRARVLPTPALQLRPQAPRPRCVRPLARARPLGCAPALALSPNHAAPCRGRRPQGVADRVVPEGEPRLAESRLQKGARGGGLGPHARREGRGRGLLAAGGPAAAPSPQRPSPADHRPLSLGAGRPASRTRGARARLGQLRVGGAVHQVQPHLQALPQTPGAEKRPSPNTYDILPGCFLQRSRPPAFSLSRSPAFDSWVSYCKEATESGQSGAGWDCGLRQLGGQAAAGAVALAAPRPVSLQPSPLAQPPTTWRTATTRASPQHPEWSSRVCEDPSATTRAPSARFSTHWTQPASRYGKEPSLSLWGIPRPPAWPPDLLNGPIHHPPFRLANPSVLCGRGGPSCKPPSARHIATQRCCWFL